MAKGIVKWFGAQVTRSLRQQTVLKLRAATKHVRDRTAENISVDVERLPDGRVIRSKPGEFPRRDTRKLFTTLQTFVDSKLLEGRVESPMAYALPLEQDMDRQFLTRTLREELPTVQAIMTAPINLQGG